MAQKADAPIGTTGQGEIMNERSLSSESAAEYFDVSLKPLRASRNLPAQKYFDVGTPLEHSRKLRDTLPTHEGKAEENLARVGTSALDCARIRAQCIAKYGFRARNRCMGVGPVWFALRKAKWAHGEQSENPSAQMAGRFIELKKLR